MERTALLSVAAGMIVFLGLHLAFWRGSVSSSPRMFLLAALAGIGLAVSTWMQTVLVGWDPVGLASVLWMDLFLLMGYFFVYAGVCRSVSVTLLSRLLRSGNQRIGFESLLEDYVRSTRFEDRIHLMDRSGLVRLSGNSVRLTPKGLAVARLVRFLSAVTGRRMEG